MRRALATLAIAAAVTAGAGAAWASGTVAADGMHDRMTSKPMSSMPSGSTGMTSMHTGSMPMSGADMDAMHAQMRQAMPADMADACDAAHTEMTQTTGTTQPGSATPAGHAAHHPTS
jgi:hypothetical protein